MKIIKLEKGVSLWIRGEVLYERRKYEIVKKSN